MVKFRSGVKIYRSTYFYWFDFGYNFSLVYGLSNVAILGFREHYFITDLGSFAMKL